LDHRFLEFLGNFFLNAAQGQKQMADLIDWMEKGGSGYEKLTAMFRKFYDLETPAPSEVEAKKRDAEALHDFQQSFNAYLRLWGVVSGGDHQQLLDKIKKLEEKCKEQENMIRNLKQLLNLKITDQNEFLKSMQDIMADQNRIFQQMVQSFWEIGTSDQAIE
jgi:uncharacterized protein (DUF2147 family)